MCSCFCDAVSQCNNCHSLERAMLYWIQHIQCPWLRYVFQSFLSLVGWGIFLKPSVPSIDYGSGNTDTWLCVFSSSLVSISDLPNPSQTCMYVRCSALSPKLILKPLFIFDYFPLNARCLFIVRASISNLSQIDVRFVTDRWHTLEWRSHNW